MSDLSDIKSPTLFRLIQAQKIAPFLITDEKPRSLLASNPFKMSDDALLKGTNQPKDTFIDSEHTKKVKRVSRIENLKLEAGMNKNVALNNKSSIYTIADVFRDEETDNLLEHMPTYRQIGEIDSTPVNYNQNPFKLADKMCRESMVLALIKIGNEPKRDCTHLIFTSDKVELADTSKILVDSKEAQNILNKLVDSPTKEQSQKLFEIVKNFKSETEDSHVIFCSDPRSSKLNACKKELDRNRASLTTSEGLEGDELIKEIQNSNSGFFIPIPQLDLVEKDWFASAAVAAIEPEPEKKFSTLEQVELPLADLILDPVVGNKFLKSPMAHNFIYPFFGPIDFLAGALDQGILPHSDSNDTISGHDIKNTTDCEPALDSTNDYMFGLDKYLNNDNLKVASDHQTKSRSISTAPVVPKPKKKVEFQSAYDGSLQQSKTISVDDSRFCELNQDPKLKGRMLLRG